jgi:GT2 family glycosyltransferase
VQLEALAGQQWSEPWEVIVSDNGSTDESRLIVEKYRQRMPNLRLVDASDRRGSAYARNIGVQAACGDILAFCDADDEVAPGWVAAMGEALATHDFVAGRLEPDKLNEPWVLKTRRCPQQNGLQIYDYPPYLPHAAGCNLGVKRTLHEAVNGFEESLFILNDTDYCWRVQLAGATLHSIPHAVVHYRFRHSMWDIYWQAFGYGMDNVLLYKKYRAYGMPELSWSIGAKKWLHLLRNLHRLRRRRYQAAWLWRFAWHLGRVLGSIKYRIQAI